MYSSSSSCEFSSVSREASSRKKERDQHQHFQVNTRALRAHTPEFVIPAGIHSKKSHRGRT